MEIENLEAALQELARRTAVIDQRLDRVEKLLYHVLTRQGVQGVEGVSLSAEETDRLRAEIADMTGWLTLDVQRLLTHNKGFTEARAAWFLGGDLSEALEEEAA